MTFRESDDRIVPLHPEDQSGGDKPSNIGVGKAVGILRDPDRAPTVLSDGTSVLTRLDRSSMIRARRISETIAVPSVVCTPPFNDCAVDSLPACVATLPSKVWEPDAGKRHVRIYEGPEINEAEHAIRHHSSTGWQTGNANLAEEIPAYSPEVAGQAF
jgi:hypothetical protein